MRVAKNNLRVRDVFRRIRRWLRRPENCFAVIYIAFGLCFLIVIPPMQVADENNHFFRAYQVAQGGFISTKTSNGVGGLLPSGVVDFAASANKNHISFHADQRFYPRSQFPELLSFTSRTPLRPVEFVNTALYSPVNYAIPAVTIKLVEFVTSRVWLQFYLARVGDFLFLGVCLFYAIKIIPFGKWALVVLGLLPMTLYEAVSISADVYIIALTALFIAYWLYLYKQRTIGIPQWLILGVLSIGLAFSKQSYFVFAGATLLLLLPVWKDRAEVERRLLPVGIIGLATLVVAFTWVLLTNGFNVEFIKWAAANGITGADPRLQLILVLRQPAKFLGVILNTWLTNNGNYIWWTTFGEFGWLDTPLPLTLILPLVIIVFLSFGMPDASSEADNRMGVITTAGISLLGLTNVLIITVVLFAFWTIPGSGSIVAYQGRYFIPLLIFLIPILVGRYRHNVSRQVVIFGVVAVLIGAVGVLSYRYYNLPFPAKPLNTSVVSDN